MTSSSSFSQCTTFQEYMGFGPPFETVSSLKREVSPDGDIFPDNKWKAATVAWAIMLSGVIVGVFVGWAIFKCNKSRHSFLHMLYFRKRSSSSSSSKYTHQATRQEKEEYIHQVKDIKNKDCLGIKTRAGNIFGFGIPLLCIVTAAYFSFFVRGISFWNWIAGAGILGIMISIGLSSTIAQIYPALIVYLSGDFQEGDVIGMTSSVFGGVFIGRIDYIGWHTSWIALDPVYIKSGKSYPRAVLIAVPTSSLGSRDIFKVPRFMPLSDAREMYNQSKNGGSPLNHLQQQQKSSMYSLTEV